MRGSPLMTIPIQGIAQNLSRRFSATKANTTPTGSSAEVNNRARPRYSNALSPVLGTQRESAMAVTIPMNGVVSERMPQTGSTRGAVTVQFLISTGRARSPI